MGSTRGLPILYGVMKNLDANRIGIVFAAAFAVLLLLAAILWGFSPEQQRDRYNVTFPDTAGGSVHHEWRLLPEKETREERIELLIREVMLGPVSLGAVPVVPEDTRLQGVILDTDTDTVYLDFSRELVLNGEEEGMSYEIAIDYISRNIRHNCRHIGEIVVTVEGQIPDVPRFDEL